MMLSLVYVSYYGMRFALGDHCVQEDSSPISVFYFDGNVPNRKSLLPLARNALRKLRTIRHPDVLKFIGVVENDTTIYIMTERVKPLGMSLSSFADKSPASKEEWLTWGLHRITVSTFARRATLFFMSHEVTSMIDCFGLH